MSYMTTFTLKANTPYISGLQGGRGSGLGQQQPGVQQRPLEAARHGLREDGRGGAGRGRLRLARQGLRERRHVEAEGAAVRRDEVRRMQVQGGLKIKTCAISL